MSDTERDSFDHQAVDNYAKHLAKVNESKAVVATYDILNDQNAVLVKAGSQIDTRTTERIVKFKLLRPLEESVAIEGDIDSTALFAAIGEIVAKSPIAQRIHQRFDLDRVIKTLCDHYQKFPILRQKITVLSMQLDRIYTQALFSSWVAAVVGCQLQLSPQELEQLFIATIAHDIGKLHIEESILNKEGSLSPEEWRQIYAHPIICEKILSNIEKISRQSVRAVREHHERCDGTGYPSGLSKEKLHQFGQIIAMADTIAAVLFRMQSKGRSFRDLLPVLQINRHAHFSDVYDAFIIILQKAELSEEGVVAEAEMPKFIDYVLQDNRTVSALFNAAYEPLYALGFDHGDHKLAAMQTVVTNISTAVRGTGILDEGYLRFLQQVKDDGMDFAYREIEDVALMLEELHFQFRRLKRLLKDYLEFQGSTNLRAIDTLSRVLGEFETIKIDDATDNP